MKRRIALFLTLALLLSGCGIFPKTPETRPGSSGSSTNIKPPEVNKKTGVEIHDNAPDLAKVGVEEYLAYFENSGVMADMGEFHDERNPYEERLAAEKEALGKNFEEYYLDQSTMIAYFERLVEKNLDAYNEDKDFNDNVLLYLTAFYSWDLSMELAMGSTFSEEDDWGMLQRGIIMAVEMFGGTDATVTRNAAHNYTITYTKESGEKVVDYFRADSGNGIQMLSYQDGVLNFFFEYIEMGNDTYVWQSNGERLVMRYKDKVVYECYYSSLPEDAAQYTEAELLYGKDITPDPVWVMDRGDFHTQISYDGTTLDVTTVNFFIGGIGHAEISPVTP